MIPAAVLIYVLDIKAGTRWYRQAFPEANLLCVGKTGPGVLDINGFSLEVVQADAKVSAGKQGTVLYWSVESLPETVKRGPPRAEGDRARCDAPTCGRGTLVSNRQCVNLENNVIHQ